MEGHACLPASRSAPLFPSITPLFSLSSLTLPLPRLRICCCSDGEWSEFFLPGASQGQGGRESASARRGAPQGHQQRGVALDEEVALPEMAGEELEDADADARRAGADCVPWACLAAWGLSGCVRCVLSGEGACAWACGWLGARHSRQRRLSRVCGAPSHVRLHPTANLCWA